MDHEEVKNVVRIMLGVLSRIAKRTRTPADDLMVAILKANQERLTDVVLELLQESASTAFR